MSDRIRRRARIRGRVQGVFFRDSIRQQAEAHGLAGWATNCYDGSLEAVLEGPAPAVQEVLRFVREGPPRARVEDVSVEEQPPSGLSGFEIR